LPAVPWAFRPVDFFDDLCRCANHPAARSKGRAFHLAGSVCRALRVTHETDHVKAPADASPAVALTRSVSCVSRQLRRPKAAIHSTMGAGHGIKCLSMHQLRMGLPPCAAGFGAEISLFRFGKQHKRQTTIPADQNRRFCRYAGQVIAAAVAFDGILGNA